MSLMTKHDEPPDLEFLVAELTEAAYPVALRHRGRGSWVDLELDLWRALEQVLYKWQRQKITTPTRAADGLRSPFSIGSLGFARSSNGAEVRS